MLQSLGAIQRRHLPLNSITQVTCISPQSVSVLDHASITARVTFHMGPPSPHASIGTPKARASRLPRACA
jgi:hypothetical protein